MKLDTLSVTLPQTQLHTEDLSVKSEMLKLLEENIGNTLQDTAAGKGFLTRTPFVQILRPANDR